MRHRNRRLAILISITLLATIFLFGLNNTGSNGRAQSESLVYDDNEIRITFRNQSIHSIPSIELTGPFQIEPRLPKGIQVVNETIDLPGRVIDSYGNKTCTISQAYGVLCWELILGEINSGIELGNRQGFFTGVSVGRDHTCAINEMNEIGTVMCWGTNLDGQLGNPNQSNPTEPQVIFHPDNLSWEKIEAGAEHTCALDEIRKIYCWGQGKYGQLGYGGWEAKFTPNLVKFNFDSGVARGNEQISDIIAGSYHNCATTTLGKLYCWGWNGFGQLGLGNYFDGSSPSRVFLPDGGSSDVISLGLTHTCSMDRGSKISHCWGDNRFSQIENESNNLDFNEPFQIFDDLASERIITGSKYTCSHSSGLGLLCRGLGVEYAYPEIQELNHHNLGGDYTCVITKDLSVNCLGDEIDWDLNLLSPEISNMKVVSKILAGSIIGVPQQNYSSVHRISVIGEVEISSEFSISIEFGNDSDGDGWKDFDEKDCGKDPYDRGSFPLDWDDDGFCDANDWDDDGDYVADVYDIFPYDKDEWKDDDRDGIGSNADSVEFTGAMIGAAITLSILIILTILELNATFRLFESLKKMLRVGLV